MKLISLLLLLSPFSLAAVGVDVSVATSLPAFSCLSQNGYIFSVVRGYTSYGEVDPNVISNIQNARQGGMRNVDVYLFPCYPCGNPQTQAQDLSITISNQNYGMI